MKLNKEEMDAVWVIESEKAGVPELVGCKVKIQVQQINPMIRRAVITPVANVQSSEKFFGLFKRLKPQITSIDGDLLLASLGIIARRQK
jgi:hypothetical protein